MIISVQNQKGGVGKTTLSLHIASVLATQAKVLLIDADPQGSARDWAAARQRPHHFPIVAIDRPTVHKEVPKLAPDYDYILIDGPPRVTDLARSCIIAADVVLIPVQPSPYDVWAAQDIVRLVQEATVIKPNLKSVFVINRRITNTAIGRDVKEALAGFGLPVLQTSLAQRVVYAESAARGEVVMETAPASPASQEVYALVQELLAYACEKGAVDA
ncbi:MAG: ParA family partition ATPase [Gloeomargarita sp. SKYBB_i_bin120]|nr:AAA family ATPase [Gloeomargarita sp. SKYB120]MDW8178854.1 ParA family partition ATPase [Gloeomargarita sp. SKYBB_i_bin120]